MVHKNTYQIYGIPSEKKLSKHEPAYITVSFLCIAHICKLISVSPVTKEMLWQIFKQVIWISRYPQKQFVILCCVAIHITTRCLAQSTAWPRPSASA